MSKNGNPIGIMLIIAGIIVFLGCAAVSVFSSLSVETGSQGGAVLGVVLSLLVSIPLVGSGIFLMMRGKSETAKQAHATRHRKILDMVKTRGQVAISDLVIELDTSIDQTRNDIYTLVGMGLLKGYVNWDKGLLYSSEASQLKTNTCPNCGGELALGGKGVVTCPYCGTDIFL